MRRPTGQVLRDYPQRSQAGRTPCPCSLRPATGKGSSRRPAGPKLQRCNYRARWFTLKRLGRERSRGSGNRSTRRLAPAVDPQRFVRIDRRDRSCRFSGPGPHRSSARSRELALSSSRLRHGCNTAASRTALGCEHDSNVRGYGGPRALRRGRKRAAVRCPVASLPDDGDCCRRCCAVLRSLVV